jgi:hypothetical protein
MQIQHVNADFEEWARTNPGYNVLNPDYIQLNQLLNDAERRWKDTLAKADNEVKGGASLPFAFPEYRNPLQGIDPSYPHVSRRNLVAKIYDSLWGNDGAGVILFSSPPASGKPQF